MNSVGDQNPASPIRRQGGAAMKNINDKVKARAQPAARKRRLGPTAQAQADLQEAAALRLSGSLHNTGSTSSEWPPRVGSVGGEDGSSVFAPMSMPFQLEPQDQQEETTAASKQEQKQQGKATTGFGSMSDAQVEHDQCLAFSDSADQSTTQVMLMQIPHLPNIDVLNFGTPVSGSGNHSNSAVEKSGEGSEGGEGDGPAMDDEDDAKRGRHPLRGPRVGSDRSTTDKFLGSGATKHDIPIEQTIRRAKEGQVGTLRVYKSGRTELIFGDMPLRVVDGPTTSSYHELVYLQTKDQSSNDMDLDDDDEDGGRESLPADKPTICFLGPIDSRVTLVPDLKWLLKNGGGVVLNPKNSRSEVAHDE